MVGGIGCAERSRFGDVPRAAALAILLVASALIGLGVALPPAAPAAGGPAAFPDMVLYRAIVARVRGGEPYEAAALTEQRADGYPVVPFLAVRPPLLATLLARLPDERSGDRILQLLAVAVLVAWTARFRKVPPLRLALVAAGTYAGIAACWPGGAGMSLFHETWAGLLIALSLALRTDRRFAGAVACGLLAALVRELALPYLAVMAGAAMVERRRGEALTFAAALATALAALAWHARALGGLVGPGDLASSGWIVFGGWPFVVASAKWNLVAIFGGAWAAAAIVPLALLGAAAQADGRGRRLGLVLAGYTLGFVVVGRPENSYWGLVIAPLGGVALGLAPPAVGALLRRAAGR